MSFSQWHMLRRYCSVLNRCWPQPADSGAQHETAAEGLPCRCRRADAQSETEAESQTVRRSTLKMPRTHRMGALAHGGTSVHAASAARHALSGHSKQPWSRCRAPQSHPQCTHCRLKADPYLAELRAAAGVVHKDGVADLKGHILRVAERVRLLSGAAVAALTQHSTTKQRRRHCNPARLTRPKRDPVRSFCVWPAVVLYSTLQPRSTTVEIPSNTGNQLCTTVHSTHAHSTAWSAHCRVCGDREPHVAHPAVVRAGQCRCGRNRLSSSA